jgi:uncharacterized protein (DUF488 family)
MQPGRSTGVAGTDWPTYLSRMAPRIPFFTIGHSTRSLEEFMALLREAGVKVLVDVRTVPRSRANPQFNPDTLAPALAREGIGYGHVASLGGLRKASRAVAPEVNGFWENRSFHNYADYAMGEAFRAGLEHLRALGHAAPCAVMCAEAVWCRCHRRIIADYLIAAGETVLHILGPGHVVPATLTPAARVDRAGCVTYPASAASA